VSTFIEPYAFQDWMRLMDQQNICSIEGDSNVHHQSFDVPSHISRFCKVGATEGTPFLINIICIMNFLNFYNLNVYDF
jgi:hypothetical protein